MSISDYKKEYLKRKYEEAKLSDIKGDHSELVEDLICKMTIVLNNGGENPKNNNGEYLFPKNKLVDKNNAGNRPCKSWFETTESSLEVIDLDKTNRNNRKYVISSHSEEDIERLKNILETGSDQKIFNVKPEEMSSMEDILKKNRDQIEEELRNDGLINPFMFFGEPVGDIEYNKENKVEFTNRIFDGNWNLLKSDEIGIGVYNPDWDHPEFSSSIYLIENTSNVIEYLEEVFSEMMDVLKTKDNFTTERLNVVLRGLKKLSKIIIEDFTSPLLDIERYELDMLYSAVLDDLIIATKVNDQDFKQAMKTLVDVIHLKYINDRKECFESTDFDRLERIILILDGKLFMDTGHIRLFPFSEDIIKINKLSGDLMKSHIKETIEVDIDPELEDLCNENTLFMYLYNMYRDVSDTIVNLERKETEMEPKVEIREIKDNPIPLYPLNTLVSNKINELFRLYKGGSENIMREEIQNLKSFKDLLIIEDKTRLIETDSRIIRELLINTIDISLLVLLENYYHQQEYLNLIENDNMLNILIKFSTKILQLVEDDTPFYTNNNNDKGRELLLRMLTYTTATLYNTKGSIKEFYKFNDLYKSTQLEKGSVKSIYDMTYHKVLKTDIKKSLEDYIRMDLFMSELAYRYKLGLPTVEDILIKLFSDMYDNVRMEGDK